MLQERAFLVVGGELADTVRAGVGGASDAVLTVALAAACLAHVATAHQARPAAVAAGAFVAAATRGAFAIVVTGAFDVLLATARGIAGLVRGTAAGRAGATPLDAGVHRAIDAVVAVASRAAAPAGRRAARLNAALFAFAAAWRLAALAPAAHADGARIVVRIALLVAAALFGAACRGTALGGLLAERMTAQSAPASVGRAEAAVVADRIAFALARLLRLAVLRE